jgi:hypothetical protein
MPFEITTLKERKRENKSKPEWCSFGSLRLYFLQLVECEPKQVSGLRSNFRTGEAVGVCISPVILRLVS